MGPILQEQASTALKRGPAKDKIRMKNAENSGAVNSSSKKASKVNQNQRPSKRTGTSLRNGQDVESFPKTEKVSQQHCGNRAKSDLSPLTGNRKLPKPQAESDGKSQQQRRAQMSGPEERRHMLAQQPVCCGEAERNHAAQVKSRRDLSLPLAPQAVLHHKALQKLQTLESLHLFEAKEDDMDSASDLSDSERLPVLPSPCTPPQLNLRAEVINSVDLLPDIPGPRMGLLDHDNNDSSNYDYPDFLPPPFNTWSLRQLAVFLNTEGKGAPRPRPVGQLEKYLERLLQLEWHQIQTVQADSGRPAAPTMRPRGQPAGSSPMGSGRPRPHTAPPTRLNSPKCLRQNQQGIPFAVLSSLTSPSSAKLSRPVCPYCHIRYPLCNGTCYSYAYHRHSRLSPLLERKVAPAPAPAPALPPKRSSSESRATVSDSKLNARGQRDPGSPQMGKSHLRQVQATGNIRRPSQDSGANGKPVPASSRKGRGGKGQEADKPRDNTRTKSVSERRTPPSSKQEVSLGKRCERDRQGTEAGWVKSGGRRPENCPPSKKLSASRPGGKAKNGHCLVK
ncbi:protein FAM217B isoform X2 [Clupea harengus]|nr:protein FAM217B isoform X2 [Clupea harengus]